MSSKGLCQLGHIHVSCRDWLVLTCLELITRVLVLSRYYCRADHAFSLHREKLSQACAFGPQKFAIFLKMNEIGAHTVVKLFYRIGFGRIQELSDQLAHARCMTYTVEPLDSTLVHLLGITSMLQLCLNLINDGQTGSEPTYSLHS